MPYLPPVRQQSPPGKHGKARQGKRPGLRARPGQPLPFVIRFAPILAALALAGCGSTDGAETSRRHDNLRGADADNTAWEQRDGFRCSVASVTDGDTLRCAEREADGRQIRVRLSGIAARETDGSCSPGHPCPDASPEAATAALVDLAAGQALQCSDEGRTYGRRAGFCRRVSDGADISCAMLASGTVARWERYWRDHRC